MCLDPSYPILICGLRNPHSLIFLMPHDVSQTFIFLSLSIFICLLSFILSSCHTSQCHPPPFFITLFASQYKKIPLQNKRKSLPPQKTKKSFNYVLLAKKTVLLKCKIDLTITKSQIYFSATLLNVLRNPLLYFTKAFQHIYILSKLQHLFKYIKGKLTLETFHDKVYFSILYYFLTDSQQYCISSVLFFHRQ